MNKEKVPVRNPDIVDRIEEKEALLFDPATGGMMCINSTGIFVWEKCDGDNTFGDIVRELESEYEVGCEVAEKDCGTFFSKLESKGFIAYRT